MNETTLRSLGIAILLLGLALGSLSRTMHVADSVHVVFTVLSILCSLSATALFVKAAPAKRRPMIIVVMVTALVAFAAVGFLFLRR